MQTVFDQFPELTEAEIAHSEQLIAVLIAKISEAGGVLPFQEFMQCALYEPGLGYYMAGSQKLGAGGDFVTAPELSPLFGHTLADYMMRLQADTPALGSLLELGAGSGVLARQILEHLLAKNALPERYLILEVSPELQARQRETLQQSPQAEQLLNRVDWISSLPTNFNGIVVANEVLDAMPVQVFENQAGKACQKGVALIDDRFQWADLTAEQPGFCAKTQAQLDQAIVDYQIADGQICEYNSLLLPWLNSLYQALDSGIVLLFDYGGLAQEMYHPERRQGSLRAFFRHRVHNEVLALPGLQDITANVNFTQLGDCAEKIGFKVQNYSTQANFLLDVGLLGCAEQQLALLQQQGDTLAQLKLTQQIKQLTLPTEMGECFKAMTLAK